MITRKQYRLKKQVKEYFIITIVTLLLAGFIVAILNYNEKQLQNSGYQSYYELHQQQ